MTKRAWERRVIQNLKEEEQVNKNLNYRKGGVVNKRKGLNRIECLLTGNCVLRYLEDVRGVQFLRQHGVFHLLATLFSLSFFPLFSD